MMLDLKKLLSTWKPVRVLRIYYLTIANDHDDIEFYDFQIFYDFSRDHISDDFSHH